MLAVAACGGDDGGGAGVDAGGGGGSATCTVNATATPNPANRTITGVGSMQCDANASLALNVCVQWNPSGSYVDIMCMMSSMSGVKDFQVQNVSSCGLANGRRFRTRVVATVDGTAQPEKLSADVGCE
ncbi:MAG TPA: hypothetical protein VIV11_11275 [Kofleriaceae bacterium]